MFQKLTGGFFSSCCIFYYWHSCGFTSVKFHVLQLEVNMHICLTKTKFYFTLISHGPDVEVVFRFSPNVCHCSSAHNFRLNAGFKWNHEAEALTCASVRRALPVPFLLSPNADFSCRLFLSCRLTKISVTVSSCAELFFFFLIDAELVLSVFVKHFLSVVA